MSFQIYFRDMRHGGERTSVCVADSSEEFRNTTVEELKRKLIPEDQLEDTILRCRFKTLQENRTLGFYGIKHEDHIIAVRRRIPVTVKHPRDSSPVHESAASGSLPCLLRICSEKRVEIQTQLYWRTIQRRNPKYRQWSHTAGINPFPDLLTGPTEIHPPPEDKVIPRSQSMENLLFDMHQPQLEHMNNVE